MEITEIRIKLMDDRSNSNERLQAFCSITFDNMFVVRDLKIIEGAKGSFVAMPSRKLTDRCPECGCKNHLRARFCNQCGSKLSEDRAPRDEGGRAKLHADIAHPINSACREFIQGSIVQAYQEELVKSQQPGYVCRYDDYDGGDTDESYDSVIGHLHGKSEQEVTYHRHPAHSTPSGQHGNQSWSNDEEAPATVSADFEEKEETFGEGIYPKRQAQ